MQSFEIQFKQESKKKIIIMKKFSLNELESTVPTPNTFTQKLNPSTNKNLYVHRMLRVGFEFLMY